MQRWLAAIFAGTFTVLSLPAAVAQPAAQLRDVQITSLATDVQDDDKEFEVIYSRMDETATAAVLFGVVGAVANSAANNAEDDGRAAPYRETAASIDLRALVADALNARLASRNPLPLAGAGAAGSHTLRVEIGEWGLARRAGLPDTTMRVFLKMNVSLVDARGRTVWGPQREHSVGQVVAQLSEFTPELLRTETESLAIRAGNQVANRVIYR